MNSSIEKATSKSYYLESIGSILNNPNGKYLIGGAIVCYILNKIIDSNYTLESTIDANSKTLRFNMTPVSAN